MLLLLGVTGTSRSSHLISRRVLSRRLPLSPTGNVTPHCVSTYPVGTLVGVLLRFVRRLQVHPLNGQHRTLPLSLFREWESLRSTPL